VNFGLKDIAEGFDESNADELPLDLANPYDSRAALKPEFLGEISCRL
jgi:hypothetical protein